MLIVGLVVIINMLFLCCAFKISSNISRDEEVKYDHDYIVIEEEQPLMCKIV